jgi:plastocyanin
MVDRKYLLIVLLSTALSISVALSVELSFSLQHVYAQQSGNTSNNNSSSNPAAGTTTHKPDSSPEVAVITINSDASGHVVFEPNNVTIRAGEEILIINNYTSAQSFTSGNGPNDPMVGTAFDTGPIQPKQFIEFASANLQDGQQYPFFSQATPSAKGTLTLSGVIPEFGSVVPLILAGLVAIAIMMAKVTGSRAWEN